MANISESFKQVCSTRPEIMVRGLVDSIPHPFIVRDLDFRVVLANEAAEEYFGEDLLGKTCYEAQHMGHSICEECPVVEAGESERHVQREERHPETGDYLQIDTYPMRDDGGSFCGVIETTQVINDRVEAMNKIRDLLREASLRNQKLVEWRRNFDFELDVAREIQRALVPQESFCRNGICFDFLYQPTGSVGGDLYDIVTIDDDRTGILIADASGHGVGAAFIAVMIKIVFRSYMIDKSDPTAALEAINRHLLEVMPEGQFATAFYGIYDTSSHELVFSRAGHPKPFVARRETHEIEMLDAGGFVLGTLEDVGAEESTISLQPGDRILFYTDGVVEARNKSGDQYSSYRLQKKFREICERDRSELLKNLIGDVRAFSAGHEIDDDLTLVMAEALETNEGDG
ncbi:MAG: SpoIIE family protein phosphatase [Planctomycetota bacterium]